jgi:Holliday junction resolvase RusA-like endonuclease
MIAQATPEKQQATIQFFAQGTPKGQPRPRAFAMKLGNGKFSARVFDAGTSEGWKSCVAMAAKPFLPPTPLTGPLEMSIDFYFARPARLLTKKSPDGEIPHTSKPDVDNLAKAVLDALTQTGMLVDDSQVYSLVAAKFYVVRGNTSGAQIEIRQPVLSAAPIKADAFGRDLLF